MIGETERITHAMALDMTANYICEICKMEHNTYSGFIQHVRLGCTGSHMVKSKANSKGLCKSIACKICEKSFKTNSCLREHIKRFCNFPKRLENSESEVKESEPEENQNRKASQKFSTVNWKLSSCHVQKKVETDSDQHKNSPHEQKTVVTPKVVEHELTDKIFACIDCGKEFNCDFDLTYHMTVHQAKKNTDSDAENSVHERVVPVKRMCTSSKIYYVLPKSSQGTSNVLLEIPDFRDSRTSKIQKQITGYDIHSEGSLIDKEYADKSFKRKDKYVRCKVCSKVIKLVSLKSHLASHSPGEQFQCHECKKTFKRQSYLQSHMRNHAKESKYECGLCGRKYKIQSILLEHMRRIHAVENRFLCDICGKLFACHTNFRCHLKTHSGERQIHQCDICGKILTAAGTLKAHMHIHTGAKPYKCSICGHGFRQKNNLNTHYRIHTGEKLYKCYVCGKDLSDSETLKFHLNIHYGKKPYKCEICDRGFAAPTNLRQHRKTHKNTM